MKQFGDEKGRLPKLGPLIGAPPRDSNQVHSEARTYQCSKQDTTAAARSNSSSIYMSAETWRALVKVEQKHRIFFTSTGEEDEAESEESEDKLSEIETIKMPPKFWRHKPSGRKGLDRFRKAVDFILLAKQLFTRGTIPQLTQEESILFFMDIPSSGLELPKLPSNQHVTALQLEMGPYKVLKEQTTVSAVKSVLETLPTNRTEEQITATLNTMQNFSKFISYPQNVQKGICQHGWYASFEPHRILCRQNQEAQTFYFILSGLAISRSVNRNDDSIEYRRRQRAQFLRKGDVIGEKEILQNISRGCTVITKERTEVLGLDKQDFLDIFHDVMIEKESTVSFLKDVEVFSDFPADLLHAHQYACSLHNYRRGAVIVHNSKESEWVYVIKEGSCQVYKAIKSRSSVKERKKKAKQQLSSDGKMGDTPRQTTDLYLPSIVPPRGIKKHQTKKERFGRRKSLSDGALNLPAIAAGDEKRLTSRVSASDSGYTSTHSEDDILNKKKKHSCMCQTKREKKPVKALPSLSKQTTAESPTPTKAFAKLEVLTTKGVFGMHSLIYDDTPSLTLVSNGSTCILVSKRFLFDHLTNRIMENIREKLAPYPSVANLQNVLDDQASWSGYKHKVVQETIIP